MAALVVDIGSCMFKACFAGDDAIRVPFGWRQAVMPGEMFISVFSAMLAATVDTCLATVLVVDEPFAVHVGMRGEVVDVLVVVQRGGSAVALL